MDHVVPRSFSFARSFTKGFIIAPDSKGERRGISRR
jgi:hypothetical protein